MSRPICEQVLSLTSPLFPIACSTRSDSGARAKNIASERAGKKRAPSFAILAYIFRSRSTWVCKQKAIDVNAGVG